MLQEKITKTLIIAIVAGFCAFHIISWINIPNLLLGFASSEKQVLVSKNLISKSLPVSTSNVAQNFNEVPLEITIHSTQIDLPIIASFKDTHNEFPISQTDANYLVGSSIPNPDTGNIVIFGHDTLEVFNKIHNVRSGDIIEIYTNDYLFKYSVTTTRIVSPYEVSILNPTSKPTLTLFTCDGWFSQNRFVVFANLTEFQKIITKR